MSTNFPEHNINPKKKDKAWHLQFCKAAHGAYESNVGQKMFWRRASKYEEIKSHAHGKQSTALYKKRMGVEEETNTTAANIDFKILGIIPKQRQTALGRLQKSAYNIVATPTDTQARNEVDEYFAQVKAKLAMRKAVEQQMPELMNHPMLQMDAKDPQDLEELEMQAEYGFKHQMAIEAEDAVRLGFMWNDIDRMREQNFINLFDDGVSVVKDALDKAGKPVMRVCDNRNVITNYCHYPDFRDLLYCGEVVEMPYHEFMKDSCDWFTEAEYEEIYKHTPNYAQSNTFLPAYGGNGFDKQKVWVLDMEWFSIDEMYFEEREAYGNTIFKKIPYDKARFNTRKYKSRKDSMVYKAKWIVGTDFIYDYGKQYNIKRSPQRTGKAELSYHIEAVNFNNMEAASVMERLITISDQIQIAWLKWQNIQNTMLPSVLEIDLDSLEDVALGKGGETMSAKEVLDMLFQNGILVSRRRDIAERNINYKAVNFIETNYGSAVAEAWNNLVRVIGMVNEIIGLNAFTDASTPNPKALTNPSLLAAEGTNNALYDIISAERKLNLKMAKAMVKRMQQAMKTGNVEGYLPALGSGTAKFIKLSPDLALHEFGIDLEDRPTDEDRQFLMQQILQNMAEGILDPTDAILIKHEPNLKRAEEMLAYRIKKRKEENQKKALEMQQMNAQVQMQSNAAAEEEKRKTMQFEKDLELRNAIEIKKMEYQIKELEYGTKDGISAREQDTKVKIKNKEMGFADVPPVAVPEMMEEEVSEEVVE